MKNFHHVLFFALCLPLSLNAQSISHQLIGTGGDYLTDSISQHSFSIGEPVADYFLGSSDLCQGFQQVGDLPGNLPLELLGFFAKRINIDHVELRWQIAHADLVDYFIVERQYADGKFEKNQQIAFEDTKDTYVLLDKNNGEADAYYRLKIVDFDGSYSYAPIRFVAALPFSFSFEITPNPSTALSISFDNKSESLQTLQVFDLHGALIFSKKINTQVEQLTIAESKDWVTGIYQIQILQNGQLFTQQYVKVD